jgi:RHS repeat-associated protein
MFHVRQLAFTLTFIALSANAADSLDLSPTENTPSYIESENEVQGFTQQETTSTKGTNKMGVVGTNALPGGGGGDPSPSQEYMFSSSELYNLIKENFGVLSDDLFGEVHDAYTGEVQFEHTDLAVSTNLTMPISVKRSWAADASNSYRIFGDWSLDLPRIYGPMLGNYHEGPDQCSTNWEATRYIGNQGDAQDSPNGPFLGGTGGSSLLLKHNNSIPAPAGTLFVTKDSWIVSCANGIYSAKSPQGLVYTFGQKAFKGYQGITTSPIGFSYANLLVTQIKDRFGKIIDFSYSNARIQTISSSDGAYVSFNYNNSNLVASIVANGRTWLYSYSGSELKTVTLPDGRFWSFDISDLRQTPSLTDSTIDSGSGAMTHPYGAVAQFDAKETLHGRSKVSTATYAPSGARLFKPNDAHLSLVRKEIDGYVWEYAYSENVGGYLGTSVSDSKTITITDPENTVTEITYQRSFDWQEGQIVKETISDGSGLLKTTTNTWLGGQSVGQFLGNTFINTTKDDHRVNLTSQTVKLNTDTYTTAYNTFDIYGNPQLTSESNNFNGKTRYTKQFYYNDTTNWLIGMPSYTQVSSNGNTYTETSRSTYHSATGSYKSLPYEQRAFGRWYKRNTTYHTTGVNAGLPNKVDYNGTNRWVEFSNYKRGIAQNIKTPQSLSTTPQSAYKEVDNNGWVTKVTDFMGYCVNYSYDGLGRMTLVDPCDTRWTNTSVSYVTTGSSEGLSYVQPGMLKQTVTRGNYQKITYLDSLLRPVMSKEWDASIAATARFSRQQFDAFNRPIYQSLPSSSSSTPYGTTSLYDGLGRQTLVDDNTTSGSVSYSYLSNNRLQVNDNKGNVTTTTYLAYGAPEQNMATLIAAPHGVNTVMAYNVFGNMTSVGQGGITESRVYDGYQQLCKTVRPDVGNTAFFKDALGQLSWQARGSSVDGSTTACDTTVSATDKATFAYDNLGNVKSVLFGDSSPDQSYVYDDNSRLETLTAGAVVTAYEYNSDNGIEKETMSVDGQSFELDYVYNSNGNLTNTVYPSGANISYSPNALGQATKAGTYATNATYHANGMVKTHGYGNGFAHTSTQNNSGLPSTFYDKRSTTYAINHGFVYDANSNLNVLDDKINNAYDLSLTYDGLDRLDIITDSYLGSGDVNYDSMGNITYYKLGSNTINYYYNSNKQLDYTTGSKSYNFNYDDKGNVTDNGARGFTYNAANQMVQSDGYLYTYDGNNKRVKEQGSNGTSYSFYASNGKLMYRYVNGQDIDYYYLGGKLVANKKGATVTYLHSDYLGSTAAESSTSGTVTSRMHYQPFGESIEPPKDDIGYTGHKFDTDLGLSYMQARYYDPVIGRFYSNDPVGYSPNNPVGSFNRYSYVNNNPYKYTDPTGMCFWDACILEAYVAVGVATAVATGVTIAVVAMVDTFDKIDQMNESAAPELPDGLVGDQGDDRAGQSRGKRHNSGPLTPENGGTGSPDGDFEKLTGGTGKPAEGRKEGTITGANGITIRPGKEGEGPRIDIPANGEKPPETLHYDK